MIGKDILHYRITEKLGAGGMGVVYKAEDTKLKREVAIKLLPRQISASDEERERFKVEAQAAAALNHPNIATIHAIEEVDDEMFIVMEYVEGKELREMIADKSPEFLKLRGLLDIATQIAAGLQAAHTKGVTHRDIKSANIMVTESGQVKIMDFGLAKIRGGAQMTKAGTTLGTAAYMSPEQALGEEVDHRADIWSFGVVLYEMISGELPFKGDYEQAVLYAILNEDPEPLTGLRPEAPAELEGIVNKALARSRDERYQDIEEMLLTLKSFREKPAAPISQTRREANYKLLIGGFSAIFMLLLGLGYFYFHQGVPEPRILRTLPLTSAPGLEENPTWSPDGTRIAYASDQSGNLDIWVRQISVGQSANLTGDNKGNDSDPAWSPDGDWLAFVSDRQGGGEPAQLFFSSTEVLWGISKPAWSPDGSPSMRGHEIVRAARISTSGRFPSRMARRGN